ncbi:uncharacterized protein Z519_03348 [Cladophialophora bantiana CBS 173.52]|uniref:Uncharacterized protein n=1 Tax=Cladophialophora bantiana (strain ATCC 10958 / CBS 173.52 / CDC B-1940 / NIH 8579) TaxID=1442370 RepID=A0A0D2IHS3_CLAB1|nr:uncharacterized protein Z519_03348 [Cladophialophora bantiana CBS 173.52]KIW96279.1 hypothetical protein Z519_03348 [Cladophialophora bantiana CBS 173.52]
MASAVAISTPPQPHSMNESPSMTSSCSPQKISPRRSPYFASSSAPPQEPEAADTVTSSPRPYTFTPQRVKSLPRAWERRPATPFVARNDAQKIWKRVPLGVIGSNIGENWRKETKRLNTRPVKRLRVAHLGGDGDKENVGYIASRWDEDEMMTPSPKRKALECGGVADRETDWEDQHISVVVDDNIKDDEDLRNSQHGPASPIFGSHDVSESWIKGEGVDGKTDLSSAISDSAGPALEVVDLRQPLAPVCEPVNVSSSSSLTAMESPSDTPVKPLDAEIDSCGEQHQNALSPTTIATAQDTIESVTSPADHDDTAYLHDFLSRARAQKAAREQALQGNPVQVQEMAEAADLSLEGPRSSHIEDVAILSVSMPDGKETSINLSVAQEPEINISPRRSSRLTTRLPRPQKPVTSLPSNISLKRLSGMEFIAANREAQSIAVATRTNTKNNKSGAVSAKVRLIQLNAEVKARQSPEGDALEPPSPEKAARKKKSRAKEVTWAAKLATFQDGEVVDSTGDEAADERNDNLKSDSNSEDEGEANEGVEKQRSLVRQRNRGVKKVRKLRKLNGGSTNGTPAPKKTTNIPLPVGSHSSLSAKAVELVTQAEDGIEGEKNTIQTRMRTRISKAV